MPESGTNENSQSNTNEGGDNGRAGGPAQLLADLKDEREKRQKLEADVESLKQAHAAQTAALADALGVKVDKQQDGADVVKQLQGQVAAMQRDVAINKIAREHGITSADDIALIGDANSEDAMARVAARLAAAESTPGTPKPDLTQGAKSPAPAVEAAPGAPRLAAAFDEAMDQ